MTNSLNKSIDRALVLWDKNVKHEDFICLKIIPFPKSCCCFYCWPKVWNVINEMIKPQGQIQDEGDVLLKVDDEEYVLECHESGPEIILLATASITLLTAIINLISCLLNHLQKERKKPKEVSIVKKQITQQQEKVVCKFDLENKAFTLETISKKLEKAFEIENK